MTETVTAPRELQGLDEFVQTLMEDWKVPGLALAIAKDGEIVHSKGYGMRDMEEGKPVTPDTLFPIASATKAFTTMSLAVLADDGKLDWDTPVREYLPSFRLYDQFASERMTPRDLVTHRSGLPRHDLMWYRTDATRKAIFDRLRYLEPNTDFRTFAQYQNLMYMTAGYLAGELSGRSWEDLVQERIFLPLGMDTSLFSYRQMRQTTDHALPYKKDKEQDATVRIPYYQMSDDADADDDPIGPAGSIKSSLADMSRWLLLHLNGGKHGDVQVVSEGQLKQMHAPQMVFPQFGSKHPETPHVSYGMGWFVEPYRGYNNIHHGGNIDGFTTLATFMPEKGLGAVILMNMNGSPVREILAHNIFDRLLGLDQVDWNARAHEDQDELEAAEERGKAKTEERRVPDTHPSHELDAYTGEFENPGYGRLRLERDGEALKGYYNTLTFDVTHYHYDIFEFYYEPFEVKLKGTFGSNVKGDIEALSIPLEPSVKDIVFTRVPSSEMMEPAFLERFVGEYDLMGRSLAVALKGDGSLLVSIPGQPDLEFEPYKGTEFVAKNLSELSIEFVVDEAGKVTEATIITMGGVFTAKRK